MQSVACRDLDRLRRQELSVPLQLAFQEGAVAQRAPQMRRINTESSCVSLYNEPGVAGPKSGDQRCSGKSLHSHQTDFHTLSIGHHNQDGELPELQK
jgi:hypothetical protein